MVVKLKNKLGNGVQTTLPFKFNWSYADPDDTSGRTIIDPDGGGDDNAPFEKGGKRKATTTPPAVIPIMWKAVNGFTATVNTTTGQTVVSEISTASGADAGATKIVFLSSNVAGDNYKLKVEIKNDAGTLIKEVLFEKWSVRKALHFTNLYKMNGGVDVRSVASRDNVNPAFSGDGYTDYTVANTQTNLTAAQSPEFGVPFLHPIPAETPSAPELAAYATGAPAAKAAAKAAMETKAQAWYQRNIDTLGNELVAYAGTIGAPASSLIGGRYIHAKLDGREGDGRPANSAKFYPDGLTIKDNNNNPWDPNLDWGEAEGGEVGGFAFIFLNTKPLDRLIVAARHEVGHASDHEPFHVAIVVAGDADHALSGLMHKTADQSFPANPYGVNTFSDDSILRLRGWRR
jgi:hypothetical protein